MYLYLQYTCFSYAFISPIDFSQVIYFFCVFNCITYLFVSNICSYSIFVLSMCLFCIRFSHTYVSPCVCFTMYLFSNILVYLCVCFSSIFFFKCICFPMYLFHLCICFCVFVSQIHLSRHHICFLHITVSLFILLSPSISFSCLFVLPSPMFVFDIFVSLIHLFL